MVRTFQEEEGGSGFGGQVVVNTVTTNATVISMDDIQRAIADMNREYEIIPNIAKCI